MKASFFGRVGAYFIDIIIITIISSFIGFGLPEKNNKYEEKINEIYTEMTAGDITKEEFLQEYEGLLYDSQKSNMLETGIGIALTAAYFVVFQYMNKGQTLGKKLLKLRVVDKDTNKPVPMVKGLLRSLFFLGIITSTISLILLNILGKSQYLYVYMIIYCAECIFDLLTVIFALYR